MKPNERENKRYSEGSENPIEIEEQIMFSQLPATGEMLLDVGCGIGTISKVLEKKGFKVKGLDFSSVAVEKAQSKGVDARLCDLDENGIPAQDSTFDVVWAGDVIEHLFDPIFMLEESVRVLKPDGLMLITVPNDLHWDKRLMCALKGRSPQSSVYRRFRQCKHHTVFSMELLDYMLTKAGFSWRLVASISQHPWPLPPKSFITKNKRVADLLGLTFIIRATPNI